MDEVFDNYFPSFVANETAFSSLISELKQK